MDAGVQRVGLSPAARSVWAKSDRAGGGWLPLTQHMLDSGHMAGWLFDHWLAPGLKRLWGEALGGEASARTVFTFLCASHDVGKAAPVFVAQVETLAQRCRGAGLPCARMERLKEDRRELPHASVSALTVGPWLEGRGTDEVVAEQLASIVGAHHGRPFKGNARQLRRRDEALGGPMWEAVRLELLDWLAAEFGADTWVTARLPGAIPQPVQVGMCGLLVMADWLASNQDFFPLRPLDDDISAELPTGDAQREREERGVGELALPHAWAPCPSSAEVPQLFRDRFGWDESWRVTPLQRAAVDLARKQPVGLMVVEAQMGAGKTEAAYACAEALAARWGAHGVFIALPTQATTDAMFARLMEWVDRLPEEDPDIPAYAMTLAHGKAMLNKQFATQVEAFRRAWADDQWLMPVEVHDDDGPPAGPLTAAVAHDWFSGRKRRLLTNFGAGTIDQVLLAGLEQKHLMVRHLALAGKVVIIDEVHASDSYMSVFTERVLAWLGEYRTPVILLSATLTQERKVALLKAYAPQLPNVPAADGYPCLTWVDAERREARVEVVEDATRPREITWLWHESDDQAIVETLRRELADGGCALVVRNTVRDAQTLADLCRAAQVAPEIRLAHARFLSADRARNDQHLLDHYGPRSGLGSRPGRAVVIATQVVEQSLDVDFDVLITDLAPMDLLFQRIGRLHRHDWRVRPDRLSQARVHVLADLSGPIAQGTKGSRFVYGDHHLLRTAHVLDGHGPALRLPGDIAPLVQRALGSAPLEVTDPTLVALLADAEAAFVMDETRSRHTAAEMALRPFSADQGEELSLSHNDWLRLTGEYSEIAQQATVRDAQPSLEVVVVVCDPEGTTAITPPWLPEPATIDTSSIPDDAMARRIASWTVRLPPAATVGDVVQLEQNILATTRHWRWRKHPLLKGQPFLVMRQSEEGSHIVHGTITDARGKQMHLRYSPERGLEEVDDGLQSGR